MDKEVLKFEIIDALTGLQIETAVLLNHVNLWGEKKHTMQLLRSLRKRINSLIKFIQEEDRKEQK